MEKACSVDVRFRSVDRDQLFLMPPDVREWLPSGHPALFLVEVVESLDLSRFVAASRTSRDRGRPAYHPKVMVGIVLYASMTALTSSRRIERALATDVGFRVVAANERPDHVTICRFITRHRDEMQDLFAQVVGLAAQAGLVDVTMVAVDGTKLAGDASPSRNRRLGDLRVRYRQWVDDVEANDAADDAAEAAEPQRGPIPEMGDADSMRAWIRRRLAERADDDDDRQMNVTDPDSGLLPRSGGGWVQGYNAQAAAVEGGIVLAADVTANPADSTMLEPMMRRIEDAALAATGEQPAVVVADAGYWHTDGIESINDDPARPDVLVPAGRRLPEQAPAPLPEPDLAAHHAALTAHSAGVEAEQQRRVKVIKRVAAGELLLREAADELGLSVPLVGELKLAYQAGGVAAMRTPRVPGRPPPPRPPTRAARQRHHMETRLSRPAGRSLYRQRQAIIEPVFGDIKTNRRITRFLRRGADNIRTEWHWLLTGHNLTILQLRTT
jgi:transposase